MTNPTRYLLRMALFLVCVTFVAALLFGELQHAFAVNPVLNTLILAVLVLGIVWCIRQVALLKREAEWLNAFRAQRPGQHLGQPPVSTAAPPPPRLLGPMASMLATRRSDRLSLSTGAMRSVLDGIGSRLDEDRELSRYMTGLLIFLGLLGTFWGLILTIGSVSDVIQNMSVGTGDVTNLFNQLKSGLAQPLQGMGVAFSSSMLGLAGSIVLGFLDLTAGQAQARFYNELEEWLAGITRLSSGVLGNDGAEGGGSVPAYVQALLEQTAENLEGLQTILVRGEERSAQSGRTLETLTERLTILTDQMRANQVLMQRVAEAQASLAPILARMAGPDEHDTAARGHMRNVELYLARLLEESAQGRAQSTQEIRSEIKVLARTIAALAEAPPPP